MLDREGFLRTLEEALGFTPKVDFNAGVVAAGEARIESTVTGNTSRRLAVSGADALVNQSQVYLPINNALSPVGHVHGFLQEIGQGIQHVASRVDDLKAFIERVNNYRLITGRGFTFLNIPRSYYGRLDAPLLAKHTTCSAVLREAVCAALVTAGLLSTTGILDLEAATERLRAALAGAALPVGLAEERDAKLEEIVATVRLSRYSNLHSLLRDHLQEEEYLQIVRNKILVDIQGSDILYQIFTANILQRRPGDEAPFLEFIQRVCADTRCKAPHEACSKPIRPGCGGFGIRNFLTLFLSIEVWRRPPLSLARRLPARRRPPALCAPSLAGEQGDARAHRRRGGGRRGGLRARPPEDRAVHGAAGREQPDPHRHLRRDDQRGGVPRPARHKHRVCVRQGASARQGRRDARKEGGGQRQAARGVDTVRHADEVSSRVKASRLALRVCSASLPVVCPASSGDWSSGPPYS